MSIEKVKKPFKQTFVGKLFSKIRFAAVEVVKGAVPGGSPVVKVVEHFTGRDLATGKEINEPTDWGAVVTRLAALGVLIYLVAKNYIPVEDLLQILKGMI